MLFRSSERNLYLRLTVRCLQTVQMKYTVGHEALDDPYHIDIIKEKLTRTLPAILPDVIDELKLAVPAYIPTKDDGE